MKGKPTLAWACEFCGPMTEHVIFCDFPDEASFAKRVTQRYANSLLVECAQKAEEDGGENGGEEFLGDELALAALLALLIYQRGESHKANLFAEFEKLNADGLAMEDALIEFEKSMSAPLSEPEKKDIQVIIALLMNKGSSQVQGGLTGTNIAETPGTGTVIKDIPSVLIAAEFLFARVVESVEQFVSRFIAPQVRAEIDNIRLTTAATDPFDFSNLRFLVDGRLQSTGYWDVVANATASRSYHYGFLKTAATLNFTIYEFKAVIDNVTTPICRAMNGRRFRVGTAVDRMEDAFASQDLETYKDLLPWFTSDEGIADATADTLAAAGIMVPPLHARCRSTIMLIR